jgi:hypothetical protein
MPVTYAIDAATGIIRTQCVGNVKFAEVIGHFRELERDPACPARLDVLLDLSRMDVLPESDQLKAVAKEMGRVSGRVQFGICAIVASRDAVFGVSRMFEVLAEDQFRTTNVFRSVKEAEDWLAEQQASAV